MGGSIVFARLGQYAPHLIHAMLPCTQRSPHPKRYLDRFSRFSTTHGIDALHFTMGCPFSLKIALSHRGIWTPSNACFLGPTREVQPFSQGSRQCQADRQTHRPTDHVTPPVTTGRTYVQRYKKPSTTAISGLIIIPTRQRASTSMYSLRFRDRVTTSRGVDEMELRRCG